jgi:hypothetical protein
VQNQLNSNPNWKKRCLKNGRKGIESNATTLVTSPLPLPHHHSHNFPRIERKNLRVHRAEPGVQLESERGVRHDAFQVAGRRVVCCAAWACSRWRAQLMQKCGLGTFDAFGILVGVTHVVVQSNIHWRVVKKFNASIAASN